MPHRSPLSIRGRRAWLAAVALAAATPIYAGATPEPAFRLVPEMETPAGIVVQPKGERQKLGESDVGRRGLGRFEEYVRALWPQVRAIDLVALSRHQLEATRGFELPAEPERFEGQAIGLDEDGRWHLELRGPRLPARYDIVHRYLYFYATFDPATEKLAGLVVTIRGWVLE